MPSTEQYQGFFQYGNHETNLYYDYEDALVGDREGLEHLRDKIQEVLDTGDEVCFSSNDVHTDFTCIKLARREVEIEEDEEGSRWVAYGCVLLVLVILALIGLGLVKVIDLIS